MNFPLVVKRIFQILFTALSVKILLNFRSSIPVLKILLAATSAYVLYVTYKRLKDRRRLRRFAAGRGCKDPPVFRNRDPFFGLDFFWESINAVKSHTALEVMQKRFDRMGVNTAKLNLMGQTLISTTEPENLKSILATDFKSFELSQGRKQFLIPFLGEGIFTTDGPAWQHSRDMLRPNFVRTQFGDIDMFERHVQNVFRAIPRDGSMVQLHDVFSSLSLDVSTEFLFGKSTGCLNPGGADPKTEEFVKSFTYAQSSIEGVEGKWGILSLFLPDFQLKKHHRIAHDDLTRVAYVDSLIEKASLDQAKYQAEKEKGNRYVFLHELLCQTTDKIKIRAELLNILLAGRETTAAVLSNVWFELSKRPAVWKRLRQEVDALEGEIPSFEQLKDMKYLRAILNESLRLYPVVPENERQAVQDTVLPLGGGEDGKSPVLLRKGDSAHWMLWTMHRRKDLYGEDAAEFRPERWLDDGDRKGLRVGWEFLPFNGGPRICIGQQFALTEISYVTVRLMQEFKDIESKDPEPWREKLSIVCYGMGGCKVILTPRD